MRAVVILPIEPIGHSLIHLPGSMEISGVFNCLIQETAGKLDSFLSCCVPLHHCVCVAPSPSTAAELQHDGPDAVGVFAPT